MVTVHRAFGYRFVIFSNDHSPPHVHITGQSGEAKITLDGSDGLSLDWMKGITHADMRRIMAEVERMRTVLIAEWRRIHG